MAAELVGGRALPIVVALCGLFIALSECTQSPAASVYFPTELSNLGSKLTTDEVRSFIHTASFIQNSNVMAIEQKVPSLNVMTAMRNFQTSKIGDYYKVLLRMWTKFGKDDRSKNKEEIFKNIESLKIPDNFKSGFKAMFDHVDGLQKVILNAASNHSASASESATTVMATTKTSTTTTTTTTPTTTTPVTEASPAAEEASAPDVAPLTDQVMSDVASTVPPPTNEPKPGNSQGDPEAAIASNHHSNQPQKAPENMYY